jgi:hypothetical protein
MSENNERFVCATCPSHDEQSGKVNAMWGAGKVLLLVLGLMLGGMFTMIMGIKADAKEHVKIKDIKIELVESQSRDRDHDIEGRFLLTTLALENNDNSPDGYT